MLRHFLLIAQKRMGSIIFYRALVPSDVISKHCSRRNAPSQPILKTCVRAFVRSGLPIIIYTVGAETERAKWCAIVPSTHPRARFRRH